MRTAAFAVTLLLFAPVLRADDPHFAIESIRVEGVRYSSSHVVEAESRLVPGVSYTERELRDAIARVHRLPFVIDADVRLEKGSERGRYVLVLRIEETTPVFANYEHLFWTLPVMRTRTVIDPKTGQPVTHTGRFLIRNNRDILDAGARLFLGSRSMVAASVDPFGVEPCCNGDSIYSLAFTRYDLFGSRASIAVVAQYREYTYNTSFLTNTRGPLTTSFGDHMLFDIGGALPLFGNHALRASWHRESQIFSINPTGQEEVVRRSYNAPQASWVYDSTNDLLFPTEGTYGEGGTHFRRLTRAVPTAVRNRFDAEYSWQHDVFGKLARYWELTPQQSVSAKLDTTLSNDYHAVTVTPGYSVSLWNSRTSGYNELRFHVEAGRTFIRSGADSNSVRAGLAYRSRWGIARLELQYFGWPD